MDFLVFSDLHLHNYTKFNVGLSRLDHCLGVITDIFIAAHKKKIKYILFTGDLYDSQKEIPTVVINTVIAKFMELFEKYPNIYFIAISGNHDYATKNFIDKPAISILTHLNLIFKNFKLIDNENYAINEGKTESVFITGIPYYDYTEHFYEALKSAKKNSILLIHQTPYGISNSHIPGQVEPRDFKNFKMVFCGHIHKREELLTNFYVVGSPLHRDLSDIGEKKGYYEYNSKTNKTKFIELKYPEFKISNEDDPYNYVVPLIESVSVEISEDKKKFSTDMEKDDLLKNYLEIAMPDNIDKYFKIGMECLSQ